MTKKEAITSGIWVRLPPSFSSPFSLDFELSTWHSWARHWPGRSWSSPSTPRPQAPHSPDRGPPRRSLQIQPFIIWNNRYICLKTNIAHQLDTEKNKRRERGQKENVKDKATWLVVVGVVGASGSNIWEATPQNDKQRDIWDAGPGGKAQQMLGKHQNPKYRQKSGLKTPLNPPPRFGTLHSGFQHHCVENHCLLFNKVDFECVYQGLVGGRACIGEEVSAPLSSWSFLSLPLTVLPHFTSHNISILPFHGFAFFSFSISKLHSSHILFTFYPLPSVRSSLQRRHVFTLSPPPSPHLRPRSNFTFLHREFRRSWWAGPCCNSHLIPPCWTPRTPRLPTAHVSCPLTSVTNASDYNITLAASEMWVFPEKIVLT